MTPSLPSWFTKAPSTLIRFQTKTELFCSVFKKICVHTSRFRIVFARPHYNAPSVLKTLLYPQCACSNKIDSCAFQYIGSWNWSHIVASSAILDTLGRVVWRPVVYILMTSPFSDSIVFSVHARKQRFQKASISNRSTPESVFELLRFWWSFLVIVFGVVVRTIAVSKTAPFLFENGLVWLEPETSRLASGYGFR